MNGKVESDTMNELLRFLEMKTKEGVRTADVAKRKKPEMQKITIRVEVENEKGEKVSGYNEEEWLASISVDEVLEKTFEAINRIE